MRDIQCGDGFRVSNQLLHDLVLPDVPDKETIVSSCGEKDVLIFVDDALCDKVAMTSDE